MSLLGFKAKNHPQQVKKFGPNPLVDERGTDPEFFQALNDRFSFTLDVAATSQNAKCSKFFTKEDDGLKQPWEGRVFCNPPYSDIASWVNKAWDEIEHKAELIVMLLPANRTEQRWWQDMVEPFRDKSELKVEFLPGRLRFVNPIKGNIGPNERPPFGCCLLIWGSA